MEPVLPKHAEFLNQKYNFSDRLLSIKGGIASLFFMKIYIFYENFFRQ